VQFCIDQYLRTVRPMQQEWVLPSARYAQVVVTAEDDTDSVRRVLELIAERAGRDHGGLVSDTQASEAQTPGAAGDG